MGYEIDFLPVGERERSGDAIALRFGNLQATPPQQTVVVIDAGYTDNGAALVDHIKRYYKTDRVDVVISTHPDADHSAGLAVVLEHLRVGQLWMHLPWNHAQDIAGLFKDGRVTDTSVRRDLRESLDGARDLERIAQNRRIPIVEPFTGTTDPTGNVVVLGPRQDFYERLLPGFRGTPGPAVPGPWMGILQRAAEVGRRLAEGFDVETLTDEGETSAENNSSAIVLVQLAPGNFALFTGDAGTPALTAAANALAAVGFDFNTIRFIQVPHHGSQRNVGPTILNCFVGPRLSGEATTKTAFVSAAKDSDPKHPSKKVMNAFRRRGAPVHATQGMPKLHFRDAPDRGWQASVALPLYLEVED